MVYGACVCPVPAPQRHQGELEGELPLPETYAEVQDATVSLRFGFYGDTTFRTVFGNSQETPLFIPILFLVFCSFLQLTMESSSLPLTHRERGIRLSFYLKHVLNR